MKHSIKQKKKNLHDDFVKLHKVELRVMDILVIFIVLMNFGAMFLTTLMVAKESTTETFHVVEANPIQASMNDFETTEEAQVEFKMFVFHSFYWAILIFFYVHKRRTIYTDEELGWLRFMVIVYLILLGKDFFNNIGYYIGVKIR